MASCAGAAGATPTGCGWIGRVADVGWLRGLGEDGLTALLERRPDVLRGVPLRDLTELAARLEQPRSLVAALAELPQPYLQLVEALQALGGASTLGALAGLLAGEGPEQEAAVAGVVDGLVVRAIARGADGRVVLPGSVEEILPSPLGLGPPLAALLAGVSVDSMRRYERALGLERQRNRAETVAALLAHLGDVDAVRGLLAAAPPGVVEVLAARGQERDEEWTYDQQAYRREQEALAWAEPRGLVHRSSWTYGWQVPAEVGLALRGPDYRAPFDPAPPPVPTWPVERVETDSTAAATAFAGQVLAVLDHVARFPLPTVQSGGVGVREIAKLAKATGGGEVEVRLALELADAAGLLDREGRSVVTSLDFPAWRDSEPAARYAALLEAWWGLGFLPTEARDPDGKALRALRAPGHCEGYRLARVAVLSSLAELDGGCDSSSLGELVRWQRPLAHGGAGGGFDEVLLEAAMLGVVAQGALTTLGGTLLGGVGVEAAAAALLPASADRATFGADLTVYVAGSPSARVSALLDACADRESSGGAVTWRFSPASVRRALDDGFTAEGLREDLAAVATGALPQPLVYLLGDVGRRHGHLRVLAGSVVLRGADEALVAEVAADRRLARLGLRAIAPTVLVGSAEVAETLAALRKAGYLPVSDDVAPSEEVDEVAEWRASILSLVRPSAVAPTPRLDVRGVAAALLSGQAVGPAPSATEARVAELARGLSAAEVRQLAHAIDAHERVGIVYESSSGRRTERIVDQLVLSGPSLFGWCELRGDERWFTVSRIRAVLAV